MYRRGSRRRWLGAVIVIALVVGTTVLMFKWFGGSGEGADANTKVAMNTGSDATPTGPGATPAKSDSDAASHAKKPGASPAIENNRPQEKISMGGSIGGASGAAKPANTQPPAAQAPSREPAAPPADAAPRRASAPPPLARVDSSPAASPSAAPGNTDSPNSQPAASPQTSGNASSNVTALQRINLGLDLIKQNKPVEARRTLSEALATSGISPADADRVRTELARLNERLVFSPEVVAGDPFVSVHTIERGDSLAKLPRKLDLDVDWRFLQRINRISDPARIQVGQRIKAVKGPFHAIVDKRAFRMDLYLGDGSDRVYVRSFQVGLGEYGATPEGAFVVKPNSKLVNPAWTNPRTGERFSADDPKNPLGDYWIGLIGASDNIRGLESYGIHGTIEPDSIGQERSMGCVRMLADDIALVYQVLMDNVSRVEIHGNDWP